MAGSRQLWTGPLGAALADRAAQALPFDPSGLWIVPTPLARERTLAILARACGVACRPRVWTWADLWAAARSRAEAGPICLSEAAARAVLGHAIAEADRAGALPLCREVADTVGFRRQLRARVAAWTRRELDPAAEPPGAGVLAEQWAIFGRYRAALLQLGAADREAFAAWASLTLRDDPPPDLRRFGLVALLDPVGLDRAGWRALGLFEDRADGILVTLPFEADRPDLFRSSGIVRDRLVERQYHETPLVPEIRRPSGLRRVELRLFRDGKRRPIGRPPAGLAVLGVPEGEGVGLATARTVRGLLDDGARPDDVLVVVPRVDDDAAVVLESLRAWGIAADGPARPPTAEPALSALRRAIAIPNDGWESADLVHLLRNGRLRPAWTRDARPLELAAAAAAVRDARVFRGRDEIRAALARQSAFEPAEDERADDAVRKTRRAERARRARPIVEGLLDALDRVDRPGTRAEHAERLRELADELGLGDEPALDPLWLALDDHVAALDGLAPRGFLLSWAEFVAEVESVVRLLEPDAPSPSSGVVRLVTVDQAEGARARHVLLVNLAEGTFPSRSAIEPDPQLETDAEPGAADPGEVAFGREMLRFLRVLASADAGATLLYPCRDAKGEPLHPAGFVDDLRRLFTPEAWAACHRTQPRLAPVPDADDAGSPADRRVRAVALACRPRGAADLGPLRQLATSADHSHALRGTAAALRVAARRTRGRDFGPYDGLLRDPHIAERLAVTHGPERPAFSPSQLESLAFCPFQFFLRYVLRLEPIEDRDELDEDRTARGSLIHNALQDLHELINSEPDERTPTADRIASAIEAILDRKLEELPAASDVDRGLRRIDRERLLRTGRRYVQQFRAYIEKDGADAEFARFEAKFGKPDEPDGAPALEIGHPPDIVTLQGMIDRIDLIRRGGRTLFRVIDYKTGGCPTRAEVNDGRALQLPLYALAAERILLNEVQATPLDVGYWSLKAKGYAAVRQMAKVEGDAILERDDWPPFREALEAYVIDLVARLRRGQFPVSPRSDDCTRLCDYRVVCRISQVRHVGKVWADAPRLETDR